MAQVKVTKYSLWFAEQIVPSSAQCWCL